MKSVEKPLLHDRSISMQPHRRPRSRYNRRKVGISKCRWPSG